MKISILVACGLFPFSSVAKSESAPNKELEALAKQRDLAVQTAIKPITEKYRIALEAMLKKETQGGNLDKALKIREEIQKIPSNEGGVSSPTLMSKEGALAKKLIGTSWLWNGLAEFAFLENGKFSGQWELANWSVIAANVVYFESSKGDISGLMIISKDFKQIRSVEWRGDGSGVDRILQTPRIERESKN